MKIKRGASDVLRTGLGITLPFIVVFYLFFLVMEGVKNLGRQVGIPNPWLSLACVLALIFLIGLVSDKTSFPEFLRKTFAKRPLVLRVVDLIFGGTKKSESSMREVLFYFTSESRARGIVTGEFSDTEGIRWCTVHFSSSPTPGMGMMVIEVRKSVLIFTGRSFSDYAAYVLSYGGANGGNNGNGREVAKIAAPIDP